MVSTRAARSLFRFAYIIKSQKISLSRYLNNEMLSLQMFAPKFIEQLSLYHFVVQELPLKWTHKQEKLIFMT